MQTTDQIEMRLPYTLKRLRVAPSAVPAMLQLGYRCTNQAQQAYFTAKVERLRTAMVVHSH